MKDAYLNIRISKELKEHIQRMAKDDNRTVSNYIEHLIAKETEGRTNRGTDTNHN